MDLLIDNNIIIDVCLDGEQVSIQEKAAFEKCKNEGGKLWLYVGSIQVIAQFLANHLKSKFQGRESESLLLAKKEAYKILKEFSKDKSWLSALADEGNVFDSENLEDEQLVRAISRFPEGNIKLLTRNLDLQNTYPTQSITPQEFLQLPTIKPSIDLIDLHTQQSSIRPQLERNIHRVLHHGQYIMGSEVRELESKLERYVEVKHCITVSSGTEALLISLMALGIKPGDEVITTPFTFVATAEAIAFLGAIPVFVDIDPETCNINASLITKKITVKTKAIIPVSLYGQVADMNEINTIAKENGNIPVIEDAAQSFGATYQGKKSCNLSTVGCTSFFPSKPLGCYGDGGAIFTNDDGLAKAFREIRIHGQSKRYYHTRIGVGGRMDTLQCAVVLAKLNRFSEEIEKRLEVGFRYNELIDKKGVSRIKQKSDRTSVFAQYTIFSEQRDMLQEKLKSFGIPTAVHYPIPLNEQPAYKDFGNSKETPISESLAKKVMSLPMSADLSKVTQDIIIEGLLNCV